MPWKRRAKRKIICKRSKLEIILTIIGLIAAVLIAYYIPVIK